MNPQHATTRTYLTPLLMLLALVTAAVIALCAGHQWISPLELWQVWQRPDNDATRLTLELVRGPRMLGSIGAGACLALSGTLLQRLTRNPLADPGVLGLNGGASLAVIALLVSYERRDLAPDWLLPIAAAAGALATACVIAMLVWGSRARGPATVLLVGIAIGVGSAGLSRALAVVLDPNLLRWVIAWQVGSLSGISLAAAVFLIACALLALPLVLLLSRDLDAVALGDHVAGSLGVNLPRLRVHTLMLAALLGAAPIAWCGGLAFVGFLAPHMVRTLIGGHTRQEAWASMISGALLVLSADTLGRTLIGMRELPAGALLGLVGAPVFLLVMARWRRSGL